MGREASALEFVRSDIVTLEQIRDRIAHSLDSVTLTTLATLVRDLGTALVDAAAALAAQIASDLVDVVEASELSRRSSSAALGCCA